MYKKYELSHCRKCSYKNKKKYFVEAYEEDLELDLLIAIGGRVMLTWNIGTDAGLANGALGVVEQMVYNPRTLPP